MHLFFSQPTSPVARGYVSAIWDPGDTHWSPQTTIFTPKTSPLSLAAFQESKDQEYSLETAKCTFYSLTPPHPRQGALYRPFGTLSTPFGAPKQQNLPPNRARCQPLSKRERTSNFFFLKTAKCTFFSHPTSTTYAILADHELFLHTISG